MSRRFWREEGLSGQATSDIGPARVVFDNSPPDGTPGVLLGFRAALHGGGERGQRPRGERREAILAGHARLFGKRAAQPIASSSVSGPTRTGPAAVTAA
jgi:monoamine oxidase